MKLFAIALGTIATALAFAAPAQYREYYGNRPYYSERDLAGSECWNPRAGHFEAVRPGEQQNDLDFGRCRPIGNRGYYREQPAYNDGDRYYGDRYAYGARVTECWNPRARHFEEVREGESQNDLDFSHCRTR